MTREKAGHVTGSPEAPIPSVEASRRPENPDLSSLYRGTPECLSSRNQGIFSKMSDRAKKIAVAFYDGLYKMPLVSRLVGKMEIAYNQFWFKRHENKAAQGKENAESIDVEMRGYDRSIAGLQTAIEKCESQGVPGADSLRIQIRDLEQEKASLLNKRDKEQSKFEARDNKMKIYVNRRDAIADKLIRRYDEKLKPMENKLERLGQQRRQVELLEAVMAIQQRSQLEGLTELENQKKGIEESLGMAKRSERQIRNNRAVQALEKQIKEGKARIQAERSGLAKRKAEIDKKVAKVGVRDSVESLFLGNRLNSYRDKREAFVRVKEGRPIGMEMDKRLRHKPREGTEDVMDHPREDEEETPAVRRKGGRIDSGAAKEGESGKEDRERLTVEQFIAHWNGYNQDNKGKTAAWKNIELGGFISASYLLPEEQHHVDDLGNILEKYFRFKNIPTDGLDVQFKKFRKALIEA